MTKANFIGIGAQKCASTWLYGALAQLPDVFVSDLKEVDYFSAFFDRGHEWYGRHFAAGADSRLRGEVSPSYFIDRDTPDRVRAYDPGMKILVTLRDPVERAFSNHLHEVRAGHVSGANREFETALDNNPLYLDQGRYAHHLGRWLALFPANQVHVTFQEDVKRDSLAETQRLARFLDVEMPSEFIQRRANESIDYKNRALGMSLWRVGRTLRKAGLGSVVERVKEMPGVRSFRKANQQDMRATVAPMKPETLERLITFYRDDVAQLAAVLGKAPPWPRFLLP